MSAGPASFSYFKPTTYDSPRPHELDADTTLHQVVIVGAGPVGLTAALDLAQRGVAVTVLEQGDQVSLGSRALALSYRSLEILGRLGIVDGFLKDGVHWNSGKSFYRDQEISSFVIPQSPDAQYPGLLNLQQPFIETYLLEACLAQPLIEIRWSTTFRSVWGRVDGATLELDSPYGPYSLEAEWVVAADGARSAVRESVGARLEGTSYSNMFVIVDVKMASDRLAGRLCWFSPPTFPGSTVLLHKQPHDIWRIDYQVPADTDPALATDPDTVIPKVRQHLNWIGEEAPWEIEWISLYRAHALTLPQYRNDRILFIGDAAHLLPIFGVRGMNSGMADAANLSWKLAEVAHGHADASLLDSFDVELRDAFGQNSAFTHLSTLFMTPGTRGSVLVRDAALDLALINEDFQALADPRYSTPIDYHHGPLITADSGDWDGGVRSGGLVPNKPVTLADGRSAFLNDLTGPGFSLIAFDQSGDADGPDGVEVIGLRSDSDLGRLLDARPGTAYLVRPDRHVLARWREWDVDVVITSLEHVLAPQKEK